MTCASVELIEAMRGVTPPSAYPNILAGACGFVPPWTRNETHIGGPLVWACTGGQVECSGVVDCPACLALMREARGGVRDDALQERESAAKSVLVNAEFDAERAAKSAEHAAVIEQARAIALGAA